MKKNLVILLQLFTLSMIWSLEIPEKLVGIWEGKDRFVFIENFDEKETPELVIILKDYYGWYYDRVVESERHSSAEKRTRNGATHSTPEHIQILEINPLLNKEIDSTYEKVEDCAWEWKLKYSKFEKNYIPVTVLGDNLYLDFYTKQPQWDKDKKIIKGTEGLWKGCASTRGFTVCSQVPDTNIGLLIVDKDKFYDVRYWLTDIDFTIRDVSFEYENDKYLVPSHIESCGNNYSSVSGKSKQVRNPVHGFDFNENQWLFSEQKTVMLKDSEPYLVQLVDKKDFTALMEIVKESNSRRKPDSPALFPDSNLDWHWDMIELLEKDNEIIKQVRLRQKEFGPRGKDFNK